MREIKFKFWLKDDESMVDWFDAIDSVGGIEYFMLSDEVDRLQFTGLTDTNGVEIYEGDIVQMYRHCDDLGSHKKAQRMIYRSEGSHSVYTGMINNIMKVSYLFGSICLNAADGSSGLTRNFSSLARPGESMEVIGNTHQNPELLEQ